MLRPIETVGDIKRAIADLADSTRIEIAPYSLAAAPVGLYLIIQVPGTCNDGALQVLVKRNNDPIHRAELTTGSAIEFPITVTIS